MFVDMNLLKKNKLFKEFNKNNQRDRKCSDLADPIFKFGMKVPCKIMYPYFLFGN